MIRLDPNLRWLYTELPMSERAAAAAADGFRGVEVAFPYAVAARDYRASLEASGLALVQILSPTDWDAGERGLASLPGREDDFRTTIQAAVAYAVDCGRPLIHVPLGNVPAGAKRADCIAMACENLRWAADVAGAHGLTVLIEACCRARIADYLIHANKDAVALIESVARSNLKLCFDTYHVAMEGNALAEDLDIAWPHVGHVQIGNAPGRHEPREGELDLHAFLEGLERRGWNGWVGLEYTPRRNTTDSLTWARALGLLPERVQ
ncbi:MULTISPECIES: hydroxypyruvate isomerase family protein [unclassified Variovorax]|uniref:hydroxypyruvate isomerase family protein n=1 Tax=unclassified Variovorax TaxID=663243 RepID=UPI0008B97F6A|nr:MULTISPECIES: TIM barrel protein [unclassified Variovorax]SEK16135.1 hydroxypyruvate isomerase [Variovorax sp. OK202]SFE34757.1 hydroxypyruvate isomerase [Variovorax sp. OK212]